MDLIRQKLLLFFSAILLTLSFIPLSVKAENNIDFSVKAIIPTNQIDHLKSYFDLKMSPGQKQDLKIKVFNNSNKEETIQGNITFATTNDNGLIDYSKWNSKDADKTLKNPLTSLIKEPQKEVVIPPGKSKVVSFSITMPKDEYDGVILGAAHFKKKVDESEKSSKSESINIKNEYAYVVGIKLSKNTKEVEPDLHLLDIKPKLVNYRTAIAATIQNSESSIVKDMSIDAQIFKKGSNKVLYSSKKTGMSMAPNSNFDYAIDLNNDPIEPGTYRLKMKAIIGTQVWEWDELFTIGKEATDLNNKAVEIKNNHFWYYIGGGLLLLIGIIWLIVFLKRKKEKERSNNQE
ncbi:DUF916 and DUF3324 domain-containing protein [Gottfriedia acidiceleris]|uniref:DUF916 and DUF3324 domain-containing protein n=1 Tax=Gottfriedia acidiceleris TaxID=371036 RepID=A0ABY4JL50_9BACI|nr:DUF916 and DUF3324 domain-containing protein [Gottfriedia acidiceleris]UPM53628.1 DUF916 and DUF3324 domain-containing protein [Gottfriedia acidiceleris]